MSRTELRSHTKAIRVTCNDCTLDLRSDKAGRLKHPSQIARAHAVETGHAVEVTRTKRATYAPKHPTTKEIQPA